MKSLFISFTFLFISLGLFSQESFTSSLDETSLNAIDTRNSIKNVGLAFKGLALQYFVQQNADADPAGYLSVLDSELGDILDNTVEMRADLELAQELNSNLAIDEIFEWVLLVEEKSEFIFDESQSLAQLIEANNTTLALQIAQDIRSSIIETLGICTNIALEAQDLKSTPLPVSTFKVRILLEDSFGNKITGNTGLQGFYAENEQTGEFIFSGEIQTQDINLFVGLEEGTYTFGAINGVFDGANSALVTLSENSPQNVNGEVVVTLIYWSE